MNRLLAPLRAVRWLFASSQTRTPLLWLLAVSAILAADAAFRLWWSAILAATYAALWVIVAIAVRQRRREEALAATIAANTLRTLQQQAHARLLASGPVSAPTTWTTPGWVTAQISGSLSFTLNSANVAALVSAGIVTLDEVRQMHARSGIGYIEGDPDQRLGIGSRDPRKAPEMTFDAVRAYNAELGRWEAALAKARRQDAGTPEPQPEPLSDTPLVGWRAWRRKRGSDGSPVLQPAHTHASAPDWVPGENTAVCVAADHEWLSGRADRKPHAVPGADCTCGFHAYATLLEAENELCVGGGHSIGNPVRGLVIGYGEVAVHPQGKWRSQYARIVALIDTDGDGTVKEWADAYGVPVVARKDEQRLAQLASEWGAAPEPVTYPCIIRYYARLSDEERDAASVKVLRRPLDRRIADTLTDGDNETVRRILKETVGL